MTNQTTDHPGIAPVILRAADHRTMPWKNGQGVTSEIAVFPPDAGLANFEWRVSMATVAGDGTFSTFADMVRTLTVLNGDGLRLSVNDARPVDVTKASPPFSFPADAATHATLLGSPVIDLNVMTRRDQWHHRVTRLGSGESPKRWQPASAVSIWFCAHGSVALHTASACAVELHKDDAMLVRAPFAQPLPVRASINADLILIEIE